VPVDHVLKAVDVNLILKFFVCCDNVSVVLQRRHSHIDHFLVGSTLLPGTIVQIYLLALDLRLNFLKETFHLDLLSFRPIVGSLLRAALCRRLLINIRCEKLRNVLLLVSKVLLPVFLDIFKNVNRRVVRFYVFVK
jgi:hypothetical protein